jgi:hypothetical protein
MTALTPYNIMQPELAMRLIRIFFFMSEDWSFTALKYTVWHTGKFDLDEQLVHDIFSPKRISCNSWEDALIHSEII